MWSPTTIGSCPARPYGLNRIKRRIFDQLHTRWANICMKTILAFMYPKYSTHTFELQEIYSFRLQSEHGHDLPDIHLREFHFRGRTLIRSRGKIGTDV